MIPAESPSAPHRTSDRFSVVVTNPCRGAWVSSTVASAPLSKAPTFEGGGIETVLPNVLRPAGTASQLLSGCYYRHYTETDLYVATAGGRVYYYDPLERVIRDAGTVVD